MSFDYGLYPCVHSQLDDDEPVQPLYVLTAPADPNSDEAFKVSVTDGLSLWHGVVTKDYLKDMIQGYESASTDRSTARDFVLSVLQGAGTEGKTEFDSITYELIWSVTAGCMQLKIGTVKLTDQDNNHTGSGSALSNRIALLAQHVAQLREHESHMVAEHAGLKADRVTFGATLARFKTEAEEHQEKMLGAMCIKLNEYKDLYRQEQASSADDDNEADNMDDSDDESASITKSVPTASATQSSSDTQPYSPSARSDNNNNNATRDGSDSDEYL
eukprot:m.114872 g.114872  ORF g.114872 m.114872 type:complete len:273 (+) comp28377_c0_seq1:248-1066(+)